MLYFHDLTKIIIACILGGIIGQQRQRRGMPIGLRTHIVVCVSAALVQIVSIDYSFLNNSNIDVMRLGAQVISGIGFLGMASIIKEGRTVVGLTTAASIWFISCVGLAVGSGLYVQSIIATLIIYFILIDIFSIGSKIESHRDDFCELEIILDGSSDSKDKINTILSLFTNHNLPISNTEINCEDKLNIKILFTINIPENKINNELLSSLFQYEYVKLCEKKC